MPIVVGLFALAIVVGLVASLLQVGIMINALKFRSERINPLNGLKRIFSAQGLAALFKSLFKMTVIGYVTYASHPEELLPFLPRSPFPPPAVRPRGAATSLAGGDVGGSSSGASSRILRGGGRKSAKPPSTGNRSRQFGHPNEPSIIRLFSRRSAMRIRPNPGPQRGQISRSVSRICTDGRGSVVLDGKHRAHCERGL